MSCIGWRLRLPIWNGARLVNGTTDSTYPGDAATQKQVSSWVVGTGIGDQQIGNAWNAADKLVSLSTNSDLNIFDKRESSGGPTQIIQVCSRLQTSSLFPHSRLCECVVVVQIVIFFPTGSDEIGDYIYSHPLCKHVLRRLI